MPEEPLTVADQIEHHQGVQHENEQNREAKLVQQLVDFQRNEKRGFADRQSGRP
jgi:hypothetical protein